LYLILKSATPSGGGPKIKVLAHEGYRTVTMFSVKVLDWELEISCVMFVYVSKYTWIVQPDIGELSHRRRNGQSRLKTMRVSPLGGLAVTSQPRSNARTATACSCDVTT